LQKIQVSKAWTGSELTGKGGGVLFLEEGKALPKRGLKEVSPNDRRKKSEPR